MIQKTKAKKIVMDMFINLAGTGVGLVALQLIVYPLVARIISSENYGQMQSVMSVVYLISGTLGATLSTTRLVREYEYQENRVKADFNVYLIFCIAFVLIAMPITLTIYIKSISLLDIVLITIIAVLNFASNYYSVGFRLLINFKAIFIYKILGAIGYFLGFAVFYFVKKWEFIFISSYLLETTYCLIKTKLISEPYKKSNLFKSTGKTFSNLGIANLLARALTYFDKLMLYPLLGGAAVSIYVTANTFGKLILMTIEPISGVVLSYLSKQKMISISIWKVAIPISALCCTAMYFVCMFVSGPILRFFYPQWAEESIKLVPLTTLCLALSAFINIMYPFTLKTIASNKQIIINGIGVITYVISVLFLYKVYGVRGCCYALLLSYTVKLLTVSIFCIRRINNG